MMKKLTIVLFLTLSMLVGFFACESAKESRQEELMNQIVNFHGLHNSDEINIKNIFVVDTIIPEIQDSTALLVANHILQTVDSIQNPISRILNIYPDPQKRIWMKTIPDSIEKIYYEYLGFHNILWNEFYSISDHKIGSKDYSKEQITGITYSIPPSDELYVIIGYFNIYPMDIKPNIYIFEEPQYRKIVELLKTKRKLSNSDLFAYLNVDLEAMGYDFVPADEDPKKSKQERQEEKDRAWKEKREKEEAERKRKEELENRGKITAANSTNQYIVTKDHASAAISKEANKRLTQYAINNDEYGIASMILNGEVEILTKGDIVSMIDLGILESKVRLASGREVYIDTSFITKK